METFAAAVVGLLIGALISSVVESIPLAERYFDLLRPSCPHCDGPRPAIGWPAILSLATGTWSCRYCGSPRAVGLAGWELAAIVGSALLVAQDAGPSGGWISVGMLGFFLLLGAVDIAYRLIPLVMVIPAAAYALLIALLDPSRDLTKSLLGGAVGFGVVFLMFAFGGLYGRWIARRRGQPLDEVPFGFGDVTLSTFIGLAVGWPAVILALVIGVLGAGAFSLLAVAWMLVRRRYDPFMPFPYGPFLILGAALVYFGGRNLFAGIP